MLLPFSTGESCTVRDGVTFCIGFLGLAEESSYICLGLPNDEFKGVGSDFEVAKALRDGDPWYVGVFGSVL